MIYESYPWKQDLLKWKKSLLKFNKSLCFKIRPEKTCTIIEKSIFYSAFIMRKLLDCQGKVSDAADEYLLNITEINPIKEINLWNRYPDEENFDWKSKKISTKKGRDICNRLIHSYVFFFGYSEKGIVDSFFVSSDQNKNKTLYCISIDEWIKYTDFIANDYVVSIDSHYDEKKKDYIYTRKERGNL